VDFKGLIAAREQLFAEAVDRFFKGEAHHIVSRDLLKQAAIEQDKRRTKDPWYLDIADFVNNDPSVKENGFVKISYLWEYCLRGNRSSLDQRINRRISTVLRDLGWGPALLRDPKTGNPMRAWRKEEVSIYD